MDIIVDLFYAIMFFWMWFGIVKYRRIVKTWTGNFVWAEQFIGRWGTYVILMLFWVAMMFFWVIYPFGGLEMFK
jgi:hypothetical protein